LREASESKASVRGRRRHDRRRIISPHVDLSRLMNSTPAFRGNVARQYSGFDALDPGYSR
jgi:hypothetical protein